MHGSENVEKVCYLCFFFSFWEISFAVLSLSVEEYFD